MIRPDDERSQKLSLCPCRWLQGHSAHACDLAQHPLKPVENCEDSLNSGFRLFWMHLLYLMRLNNDITDLRIVFHRATPERIDSKIRRVHLLRESCKVPYDFRFRDLGKAEKRVPSQSLRNYLQRIDTQCLALLVRWTRRKMCDPAPVGPLYDERLVPPSLMKSHYMASNASSFVASLSAEANWSMACLLLSSLIPIRMLSPSSGKLSTRFFPHCMPLRSRLSCNVLADDSPDLSVTTKSW